MDEVKCVHHPSDFLSLMFGDEVDFEQLSRSCTQPAITPEAIEKLDKRVNYPIRLSKDLVNEFDILNADVISVYPCRLDRGKQPQYLIKTMGAIKSLGRKVSCVLFDFHSTGGDKVVYKDELIASELNWIAINELEQPMQIRAKIRYLHKEAEATITPLDVDRVHVKFVEPQMAITPGQAVVFYQDDVVIGAGTIERKEE